MKHNPEDHGQQTIDSHDAEEGKNKIFQETDDSLWDATLDRVILDVEECLQSLRDQERRGFLDVLSRTSDRLRESLQKIDLLIQIQKDVRDLRDFVSKES